MFGIPPELIQQARELGVTLRELLAELRAVREETRELRQVLQGIELTGTREDGTEDVLRPGKNGGGQ